MHRVIFDEKDYCDYRLSSNDKWLMLKQFWKSVFDKLTFIIHDVEKVFIFV